MKLNIKYDINLCCKMVLQDQLDLLELPWTMSGLGDVEIQGTIPPEKYNELELSLKKYGIEIMDDPKNIFVQKIKDVIVEMIYVEEALPNTNISDYLAKKLNKTYNYVSAIFSEVTFTTIQNFIILQKIERTKQELIEGNDTLTEIAWKLNFSSVAHLSNEFKRITGLTPTAFQRIIKKRNESDLTTEE